MSTHGPWHLYGKVPHGKRETAWLFRSDNPNDPWWYCPSCNLAMQFPRGEEKERDRSFANHIATKECKLARKNPHHNQRKRRGKDER